MKDELKSMKDNDIWDLVELPKGKNRLVVNECSKSSEIRKAISKGIRHVLSQMDSFKQRALTIRRPSPHFHEIFFFWNYHGTSGPLRPGVTPNGY